MPGSVADLERAWLLVQLGMTESTLSTTDLQMLLTSGNLSPVSQARLLGSASTQVPYSTTSVYNPETGFIPTLSVPVTGKGETVQAFAFFAGLYCSTTAGQDIVPFITVSTAGGANNPLQATTFRSPVTTDGPSTTIESDPMVLVNGTNYVFKMGVFGSAPGTFNAFSGPVNESHLTVKSL